MSVGVMSGGYHELCGSRTRYRVLNLERLLLCLGRDPGERVDDGLFFPWYTKTLDEALAHEYLVREPVWSEAAAVGSASWIEGLIGPCGRGVVEALGAAPSWLGEELQVYSLRLSTRDGRDLWARKQ